MPKSRTAWSLLIGLVLLVAMLAIGVAPRLRQSAELVAAATAPDVGGVPVSVVAPRRADGPTDLILPSNIQAIEETAIYARTNGYVRERYVDIRDRVKAGTVLAQIDTPELDQELSQARAALAQTRSGLAQAQASFTQARRPSSRPARASINRRPTKASPAPPRSASADSSATSSSRIRMRTRSERRSRPPGRPRRQPRRTSTRCRPTSAPWRPAWGRPGRTSRRTRPTCNG